MHTYTQFPIAIPKLIENIVTQVSLNLGFNITYKHGSWIHLMNQINDDKKAPSKKNIVYPLIMLIHEFEERRKDGVLNADLDIVIVTPSNPTDYYSVRYTKNYLPTLYPIYAEFMHIVANSAYFLGNSERGFNHTKIDALNMGVNETNGNVAYKLPDYLDGLVIKKLELTINETNCTLQENFIIN